MTLYDGSALRYLLLPDGRRQAIGIALPGDFLGIQDQGDRTWNHSAVTVCRTSLCFFDRAALDRLLARDVDVARQIALISRRDEAILFEHLTGVGRRSGEERIVHLMLELFYRLQQRGKACGRTCYLPLTQEDAADMLGLTAVHLNRLFGSLRDPDGTSPSGNRTARPNRRVDTLISIRFTAQLPSQSSAVARFQLGMGSSRPSTPRTRGRYIATLPPWNPTRPRVLPQRCAARPSSRPQGKAAQSSAERPRTLPPQLR